MSGPRRESVWASIISLRALSTVQLIFRLELLGLGLPTKCQSPKGRLHFKAANHLYNPIDAAAKPRASRDVGSCGPGPLASSGSATWAASRSLPHRAAAAGARTPAPGK